VPAFAAGVQVAVAVLMLLIVALLRGELVHDLPHTVGAVELDVFDQPGVQVLAHVGLGLQLDCHYLLQILGRNAILGHVHFGFVLLGLQQFENGFIDQLVAGQQCKQMRLVFGCQRHVGDDVEDTLLPLSQLSLVTDLLVDLVLLVLHRLDLSQYELNLFRLVFECSFLE